MGEWFQYQAWTGDMQRAPRARRAFYDANEVIGVYAGEFGLEDPQRIKHEQKSMLARHVAEGERLRTDSDDIDAVGRMLTNRLYRNPGKTNARAFRKQKPVAATEKILTRRQALAERQYIEDDDGVPARSFDSIAAIYDMTFK